MGLSTSNLGFCYAQCFMLFTLPFKLFILFKLIKIDFNKRCYHYIMNSNIEIENSVISLSNNVRNGILRKPIQFTSNNN